MLAHANPIHGRVIDAIRHDVGNHMGFITTNILYGLNRPDLRDELARFIKETAARL